MDTKDIKWFIGSHHFEIYKEEQLTDCRGNVIGKVIINRCNNCGKIRKVEIRTNVNF